MAGRVARAIVGVAGVLTISRLLGFMREVVIADVFGTTARYDLYLVAVMLPALVYGVLNFSVVYLFVPYFSRRLASNGSDAGSPDWSEVWPAINLSLVSAGSAALLIAIAAPYVLEFWTGNYLAEQIGDIVLYCRLMALMVLLGATEACMRAYLNVCKVFSYPAAGYIVYNVFCIAAIIVLHDSLSVGAIVVAVLGGMFVQNVYLLMRILSYKPFRRFAATVVSADSKAILATGGILVMIELINRSYFLVDRYVAPKFGEGIISAINYSQVVVQLPDSIIGLAIGAVVFPLLSQAAGNRSDPAFGKVYQKAVTGALLMAVPIAVFFFLNAADLVHLMFQRGQFDPESAQLTAAVLRPYAPSIAALFVVSTSIRACYSGGWARHVFGFALIVFALKYAGTFILSEYFGYTGITAATSVAHVTFAVLLLVLVTVRATAPNKPGFVRTLLTLILTGIVAALAAGYVGSLSSRLFDGIDVLSVIGRLVLSGIILFGVYWLCLRLLGMHRLLLSNLSEPKPEGPIQ